MGRHNFDVVWATPRRRRSRSSPGLVIGGVGLAVILLVLTIVVLNQQSSDPPSNETAATSAVTSEPIESAASTPVPAAVRTRTVAGVMPVTVLNNSAVNGLAARVAAVLESNGWPIADLRNYSETQVSATTVFFTAGAADEEAAAQALVAQFPQISGGAQPRFDGLDGTGLTVTAVGDWLP